MPFHMSGQGRSHLEGDIGAETGRIPRADLGRWEGTPDSDGSRSSSNTSKGPCLGHGRKSKAAKECRAEAGGRAAGQ